MRVLVVGGYGLIGGAITAALLADGHYVTGLARSPDYGKRLFPAANWIGADLGDLQQAENWLLHVQGFDVVVNASGMLQSTGRDDLDRVQRGAIVALVAACEAVGIKRFIQISAVGASVESEIEFLSSKAAADGVVAESQLDWVIFRPGLVLAPDSYGGTNLLRLLATVPLVQPLALAEVRVQVVDLDDLVKGVTQALNDPALVGQSFDIVEPTSYQLEDVVLAMRTWLGMKPPVMILRIPNWAVRLTGRVADGLALLGWETALRTTSMRVLAKGISGDPARWQNASGLRLKTLAEIHSARPSTTQDRMFSRTRVLFPIGIVVLAAFWLASGVIGVLQFDQAVALISARTGAAAASAFVVVGAAADVAIGLALLYRPSFYAACLAAIFVSAGYLFAATIVTPELWLDPIGPLVKVVPAMMLALVMATLRQDR